MDIEQIDNIFSTADKQDVQYSDAQWLYLQDNNNAQYSNYVQFITTTLKQQFIDYHNAYVWMPMRIELQRNTTFGGRTLPPFVAMRESVLSLIGNQLVSTDQGQTIVNDINTQFINNIRLEVENNLDWVWSNGSDYDFAYDQFVANPSRYTTPTTTNVASGAAPVTVAQGSGVFTSIASSYQTGPAYYAPLGIEPGNINNSPYTNDLQEFISASNGNILATPIAVVGAVPATFSSIGGLTAAAAGTADGPSGPGKEWLLTLLDGSSAGVQVSNPGAALTLTSYSILGSQAATGNLFIGGVNLGFYTTLAAGVYYAVALGSGIGLDSQPVGVPIQVPITITVVGTGGTATATITAIGEWTSLNAFILAGGANSINLPVGSTIPERNPNFNKGFLDRVTIFQNSSAYNFYAPTTGPSGGQVAGANGMDVYWYVATLPLKLLHDFWMQMNIPIINVGWNIQLFFAQTNGASPSFTFPPLQVGNNVNEIQGGNDYTTTSPAIFYGQTIAGGSGCRLYYRSVKFSPADNARMAERLTSGFTKSIKFISTDWIQPISNLIIPSQGTVQIQIEQSVVHPLRVWLLPYANNTNLTAQTTNPVTSLIGSFIKSAVYAPGVLQGYFNQTNVLVNQVPYFRQAFQNFEDQWEQLREQFNPDTGSMIRQTDWRNYKRYQVYDITRLSDRLQSPTEPVSLSFQGNRADGLPYNLELFFLVERLNQVGVSFDSKSGFFPRNRANALFFFLSCVR
jgi:hypothetical protein